MLDDAHDNEGRHVKGNKASESDGLSSKTFKRGVNLGGSGKGGVQIQRWIVR